MTDKSHSVLKMFILITQLILGHFSDCFTDFGVLPQGFYGHNVGDWQRDGRCWAVTKGNGGDCVTTATRKVMAPGCGGQ